jgi:spore maturation protein CgeB
MPINIYNISALSIKKRKYDVFFSGKVSSYRDYRLPYIESIKSLNVNSFIHEIATSADLLSYEDLYGFLGNSKIGINFSKSVDQNEQLKGRVWETLLCGALLLEQENSQITKYFTPNVHFVFFSSSQDLASKIIFYLSNSAELKRIAEAGTAKALSFQTTLHL